MAFVLTEPQLQELAESPLVLSLIASLFAFAVYLVASYFNSPLKQYPGPFLAKFTNLWRLYHHSQRSFHTELDELHKKYGPVVRVAPNVLDIDYPDLIKSVFNIKGDWRKTEAYLASSALVDGHVVYNLFSVLDKDKHAAEKRQIGKFYSAAGSAAFESHMDSTIKELCSELESRFMNVPMSTQKPVDLGKWILYYTWDVVGAVTFSKSLGYLAAGCDFDGTLRNADKAMDYFSSVMALPPLDHWFDKNPVFRMGPPGFGGVAGMAVERLVSRYQGTDSDYHSADKPDFLDRFIEAKNANPEMVDDNQIVSWLMINLIAGADTTAITIRTAFYYGLRTPGVWSRLRAELTAAGLTKEMCPIAYKEARQIPYLEAMVREALRIFPAVGLSLERYVPAGGQKLLDGSFVPENTILAFNAYVINRNRDVWGPDADQFRPERWLRAEGESDEAFRSRLQGMNNADLSFGAGSRICLGQNIALMQMYKVVASMCLLYDVEMADPEREWRTVNSFFVRQEGVEVKIGRRGE